MQKPESIIRKISIGIDYKNSMTYMRGQKVLGGEYEITLIEKDTNGTIIWITNTNHESLVWKEFNNTVPMIIEYFIDYEES